MVSKNSAINKDVDSLVTLTDTQTLSGKTLTAPKFVDNGFIADANGNELIVFHTIASALNHIKVTNGGTGVSPIVAAVGDEDNLDLVLNSKGTGKVKVGTDEVVTLTATQILTNKTITLTADPDSAMKAATKQYVDNLMYGIKWKQSVRCASIEDTENWTTAYQNGASLDGILLATNDRILIKDQTGGTYDEKYNGIYVVQASGAPVRADDANASAELPAACVFVEQGSSNADKSFVCTADKVTFTLDSSACPWAVVSGAVSGHDIAGASHTATVSTGQFLRGSGTNTFGWSTLVLPNAANDHELLAATGANTIGVITAAANSVLVTDGSNHPSWGTTLPAVTLTTPTISATGFTNAKHAHAADNSGGTLDPANCLSAAVAIAKGGTGLTSFNQGDMLYFTSGTALSALAKDTNTSRFLKNSGTNNAPAWGQIDLSVATDTTGTLPATRGGTGQTTWVAGDVVVATGTNALGAMTKGGNNTFLGVNGSGTLGFYAAGGGLTWSVIAADPAPAVVNNGYIVNSGSLVTVTLPATAAVGSVIRITGLGAGGWKLAQPASCEIHFGSAVTTTGATGYLQSNQDHDAVEIVCAVANTTWIVVSSVGNITVN